MLSEIVEQLSNPSPDHFVVEGRWCVDALLDSPDFETVAVVRGENSHSDFDEKYGDLTDIHSLPKEDISRVMGFAFHRGILALAKRPAISPLPTEILKGILVCCPELANESNLGAIIRTTAVLGGSGILVPHQHGADVFSRKCIRASSGAVFRLPIFECPDIAHHISSLRKTGFTIIGTSPGTGSIVLPELPVIDNAVVMFGPESNGLSPDWLAQCDIKLEIPMSHGMDSLNVAACAAIVLYQMTQH